MANICSVNHIFMMSDDKDGLEQMDNFQKLLEKYSNMPDPKEFSKLHLMARELGISEEELEGCNTRSFDIPVAHSHLRGRKHRMGPLHRGMGTHHVEVPAHPSLLDFL